MLFPAKQRIRPSAHPDLCLATIPPGGRSGGWERSIWKERTPSGRSWRASPPTSSCCSEKPSARGTAARRSARAPRVRRGLPAGPGVPGVRRPGRLEERIDRGRGFKVALPLLRQEVHLPHRHRPRTLPKAAPRLDLLHQAHAPQRSHRVCGRDVRRHPQDRIRVAAPCVRTNVNTPVPATPPSASRPAGPSACKSRRLSLSGGSGGRPGRRWRSP